MSFSGTLSKVHTISGTLSGVHNVNGVFSAPSYVSQTNYEKLDNKPQINSITLVGNKTGTQLSLVNESDTLQDWEIDQIIYGGL